MIDFKKRNFIKNMYTYAIIASVSIAVINEKMHSTNLKFVNKDFYTMGTNGKIQAVTSEPEKVFSIAEEAIKRMNRIAELASKFSPESDIALLNRLYKQYNSISDDTQDLLDISNKYFELTDGYFDIGLGNILTLSNIDKNLPLNGNYLKKKDLKNKIIDIKKNKAKIIRENTTIDLGGIAKGYALDEAMKIFKKNKIEHVAIELGGDIKVNGGMTPNTPWVISIDNKIPTNLCNINKLIKIYSGGIALSSSYIKKSPDNNTFKHHIINPKNLKSENEYKFTLVTGENSVTCDVLATASFNMNKNEITNIKNKFKHYDIETYN
ncbi:MAG TPA: FAD:protein FMN transferase [Candidatus Azoamicus sp. MARI]